MHDEWALAAKKSAHATPDLVNAIRHEYREEPLTPRQVLNLGIQFAGISDTIDCVKKPTWGDCADAILGLASDVAIAGKLGKLGKLGEVGEVADAGAAASLAEPTKGQKLYRVYGGDSKAGGASWSPVDPRTVPDYRDAAGLPSGGASGANNTGRFVIEGTLTDPSAVVLGRSALALDGIKGGITEYIIPNWLENGSVQITRVSGVNPEF
ncbi:hypothetical protein [Amycolatopsis pithecellobii]|uniref:Uncharacterized protein n=1 Tax=Amycolatopsis pithecellobii TaxID=664692 RepID=A0A6N7Z2V3_9PSEU|nr:hypothetical protein [Amycolatopsis pithecellobii]MTD56093.1 hypothetical protein [Amycolatopsis pithecellobii]